MSSGDETWDWISDLPREWLPPAELSGPTKSPRLNLAIMMLASEMIGNDIIDLVGQWVSESARFSIWFATEAKSKLGSSALVLLTVASHDRVKSIYEAWHEFAGAFEASGRQAGNAEHERANLVTTLQRAIDDIVGARNGGLD